MAADMAVELKKQNVACVSLWPGAVMTEHVNDFLSHPQDETVIFYIYISYPPTPPPTPLPPPKRNVLSGTIRRQVFLVVLKQKLRFYLDGFTNFFLRSIYRPQLSTKKAKVYRK